MDWQTVTAGFSIYTDNSLGNWYTRLEISSYPKIAKEDGNNKRLVGWGDITKEPLYHRFSLRIYSVLNSMPKRIISSQFQLILPNALLLSVGNVFTWSLLMHPMQNAKRYNSFLEKNNNRGIEKLYTLTVQFGELPHCLKCEQNKVRQYISQ